MIERFFQDLALKARANTGLSGEVAIFVWAGAVFAVLAFVFLSVAAFSWLATLYGNAIAALIVGCGQLVISGCGIWRAAAVRRHNRALALARIEAAAKQASSGWHIDPAYLAVGIEVVKVIGIRNIIPIILGGAAAAGWAASKKSPDSKKH